MNSKTQPIEIFFEYDKTRKLKLIEYQLIGSKNNLQLIEGIDPQGRKHRLDWNQIFGFQFISYNSTGKRIYFNFPYGAIFNRSFMPKHQLETPHLLAF